MPIHNPPAFYPFLQALFPSHLTCLLNDLFLCTPSKSKCLLSLLSAVPFCLSLTRPIQTTGITSRFQASQRLLIYKRTICPRDNFSNTLRKMQQPQLVSDPIFLPVPSLLKKQQKYNREHLMKSETLPTDFSGFCVLWKIPRKAGAQMLPVLLRLMWEQKPFLLTDTPRAICNPPSFCQFLLMRADIATLSLPLLTTSVIGFFSQTLIGSSFSLEHRIKCLRGCSLAIPQLPFHIHSLSILLYMA